MVPGALSLGIKLPGREANHSPPSSSEVKNAWSLVKYRDNLTFTFLHAGHDCCYEMTCIHIQMTIRLTWARPEQYHSKFDLAPTWDMTNE